MDGDIQFVADTFLIQRMFNILSEADSDDGILRKNAFDITSVLSSIAQSIKQYVGSQAHGAESGGVTRTVINLLAPATFFRLHPILGLLVTAAQLFGVDLYSIFQMIMSRLMPKIEAGQPLTAEEVNEAGKSAIPQMEMAPILASNDLLFPIRDLENKGLLKKAVRPGAWGSQPFLPKDSNPIYRTLGFLSPMHRGSFLVGLLVWFIKTILLSAGLLTVGGVAANALGLGNKSQTNTVVQDTPRAVVPANYTREFIPSRNVMPSSTGAGSYNYRNKPGDIWVEELNGQQPHDRVLDWTIESYPQLSEYVDIIYRTPSFWNTVRYLTQNWPPGQNQWVIPEGFNKRDDVIAKFIVDIFSQIRGSQ